MYRLVIILFVISLSGCAGLGQIERIDDLSTEQISLIQYTIEIPPLELINYEYVSLGKIKGLSCAGDGQRTVSKDEAKTQVKIKTVKAGGNAYITPFCQTKNSVDWSNNCWKSITCYSEALKLLNEKKNINSAPKINKDEYF